MLSHSKNYKSKAKCIKKMKKADCKHKPDFNQKLIVLHSNNAKEYWNIINSGNPQVSFN